MTEVEGEKPLTKLSEEFQGLANTVNNQEDLEVAAFSHACSHIIPLLSCLGTSFKFGERDFVTKVDDLAEASKSIMTLSALIDQDIQTKTVQELGSHSRNLLRVNRSLEMLKVLCEKIIESDFIGDFLKDAFINAYIQVFAPYHGWAIREAVGAEVPIALPTWPRIREMLNEEDESATVQMKSYIASSEVVIEYINNLFLSRELDIYW